MLSVLGTSMLGNSNTKVCRHTVNYVTKIGLSGQKLATFCQVANMSLTCRHHWQSMSRKLVAQAARVKPKPQVLSASGKGKTQAASA